MVDTTYQYTPVELDELTKTGASATYNTRIAAYNQSKVATAPTPAPVAPVVPVVAPAPVATPVAAPVAAPAPVATPAPTPPPTYTVQPGDSLNVIAKKLGVQPTDITGYRSGDPNVIYPKEVLTIQPKAPITKPTTANTTTDTSTDTTTAPVDVSSDQQTLDYLLKQYGISFGDPTNPQKSIKDLVGEVMVATGLPEAKTRITEITSEIEALNNKRDAEIAEVNDNPWLTESKRQQMVNKITTAYENKTNNKVNTLKLLQDTYDDARQEAQFAATAAINLYDRQRTFDQNKLEFLITQTEKSIEAKNKLTTVDTTIEEINGRKVLFNKKTGEKIADLGAVTPKDGGRDSSGDFTIGDTRYDKNGNVIASDTGGVIIRFKKSLVDRTALDKAGTREQFIRQLIVEYPEIDEGSIAEYVYATYPDSYNNYGKD